jgi:hypothetical protein
LPPAAGRRYILARVPSDSTLTVVLIFAAFGVAVGFLLLARKLRPARLPYFPKEHLLSKGEMAFYRVLAHAVPSGLAISMKTRLSDVIGCTAEGWKAGWGAKISQKHVDFVVFDPVTTAIILVIELDDRTHDLPDRQARDVFVDRALAAAGVAILRVPAAKAYDLEALRGQVDHLLRYAARA